MQNAALVVSIGDREKNGVGTETQPFRQCRDGANSGGRGRLHRRGAIPKTQPQLGMTRHSAMPRGMKPQSASVIPAAATAASLGFEASGGLLKIGQPRGEIKGETDAVGPREEGVEPHTEMSGISTSNVLGAARGSVRVFVLRAWVSCWRWVRLLVAPGKGGEMPEPM